MQEVYEFLKKAGREQAKWIKKGYKLKTKKKTGNLIKGVKEDKPYVYGKDEHQIRVYSKAPHAHLIEYGHKMIDKNGKPTEHGKSFVEGRRIVETERKAFESEFYRMADEFVDDFLEVKR